MNEEPKGPPVTEADLLRQMAERMRREGRSATAILLENAAYLAENGDLSSLAFGPKETEVPR